MPQLQINSPNINTLSCSVTFNISNRTVVFDTSSSSYNNISGHGILYVQGISFLLQDQDGVVLTPIDFSNPANYIVPSVTQVFTLDLSYLNYAFLFQTYQVVIAVKDQDGNIYQTIPVFPKVCQPTNLNETGTVDGIFQLTANCINNTLGVSELTPLVYNSTTPTSVTKSGTLYYPTGTISPVTFTGTPFQNNVVYTGEYRIVNTTVATYSLGNMIYVSISYYTNSYFKATCGSRVSDLLCCVEAVQKTAQRECGNAIGQQAQQQLLEISTYLSGGLLAESNGQSSQFQYDQIKKILNCNCGSTSLQQNEVSPINPSVYSILVVGTNGTSVTPTINGNTQTFTVSSNIYQVVKGNTGDLAFTITTATTTSGVVKYIITFNYAVMANYILTAIGDSDELIAQLNALITPTFNVDLSNLNGECVIDLSSINYFLSQLVPDGSSIVKSITFGSGTHNAPVGLLVNNTSGVEAWLNGLSLGSFSSSFSNSVSGSYFNVLTIGNTNSPLTMTFTINGSDLVVSFQKTNKSLIAVLQAIIDYLCSLTSLNIKLGDTLNLCTIDYNGNLVVTNIPSNATQDDYNQSVANSICNLANRMVLLTGVTCDKIKSVFQNYPNTVLNSTGRLFGMDNSGNCISWTPQQLALGIIDAINSFSNVKAAFCAIDCTIPATCPDISGISVGMSGSNIGLYSITYTTTPSASQQVTVRYRVNGTLAWTVATNNLLIFPNGNINGTTPFLITGVATGTTYDVQVTNNCGGVGFITQITTPTGTVYSGQYLLDNIIYNICGESSGQLFSAAPFATGVTMYTDTGLTSPLTGFIYIASVIDGTIYNINSSTGVVGSSTGSSCTSGTSGLYRVGSSTGTVCGNSSVTLYTNGAFSVGGTLYHDAALTTPVTGFIYVVNNTNGHIYNLNTSTGVIGSDTGLICSGNSSIALTSDTSNACNRTMQFTITGAPSETVLYSVIFTHDTDGVNGNYSITLDGSGSGLISNPRTNFVLGSAHYAVPTGSEKVTITILTSVNPSNSIMETFAWSSCPV